MHAYANPEDRSDEKKRSDGYGLVRFNKKTGQTVFECWDRFSDVSTGKGQFPGWPIEFNMRDNDGRKATHELPKQTVDWENPVFQVVEEATGEILYTIRIRGKSFTPSVYGPGKYTVKIGRDKPDQVSVSGIPAREK
jgi:hypothetical protein